MSNDWSIQIDFPESLNFAIYLGCALGIIDKTSEDLWPEKSKTIEPSKMEILKFEWEAWWESLLKRRYKEIKSIKEGNLQNIFFIPPEFSTDNILLQEYCNELYPSFYKWWNMLAGGKMALNAFEQMNIKKIDKYIHCHLESQSGEKVNSFEFYLDFVYTGLMNRIAFQEDFLIITPKQFIENR